MAAADRAAALQQALTQRNRTSATSWQEASCHCQPASDDPQTYPGAAVLPPEQSSVTLSLEPTLSQALRNRGILLSTLKLLVAQ